MFGEILLESSSEEQKVEDNGEGGGRRPWATEPTRPSLKYSRTIQIYPNKSSAKNKNNILTILIII